LTKTYLMINEHNPILEKAIGYVIIYLFKTPLYTLKVDLWMPDLFVTKKISLVKFDWHIISTNSFCFSELKLSGIQENV
jgi:hypothetical protein